ncbi:RidA family protein [Roseibium sediminicola]|uniref:RidA family protein n=1 Tax=Roseibium sediminicola TaxID=2933272 RepID=A0ABT0H216_9HYPH|nr:RidA family protein [Roseibium sp. CAU 1639]MCK7615721.1 RidA family protein [Roseibium sp. CAU 1639]
MQDASCPVESRLNALALYLPNDPQPNGRYKTWTQHNGLFTTSGQLSRVDGDVIRGHLGPDDPIDDARRAAQVCMLRCLALIKLARGTLDCIEQVATVTGYVNAASGFTQHSKVIDAASEILLELYGDRGRHVRTAIGASSLPDGGLVELQLTAYLTD